MPETCMSAKSRPKKKTENKKSKHEEQQNIPDIAV